MNTLYLPHEIDTDDFFSPARADAAQREWQEWRRRQTARFGLDSVLPTKRRRAELVAVPEPDEAV